MKRKSITKFFSIVLTVAMTAGFAGCGSQGNNQVTDAVEKETGTIAAGESEKETVPEEITYPLNTTDKLEYWCAASSVLRPAGVYTDWKESPFHTGLQDMTGVEVNWYYAPKGTAEVEAFNLLLTEDELPDVIYYRLGAADAQEYIEDGLIYDLTEYLPEYAPDYWAYISEHEDLMKSVTTDSGAVFGFGSFTEGDYNKTYIGPAVRQDWLDACGLDAPVTLEDWEEMLIAFKDKYNARLGFVSSARFGDFSSLGSGTGAMATFKPTYYIDDNGKVQYAQAQSEWKDYMEILNKWWEMGLIDEDSLTMNDADMRTKVANNEIGATVTAMSQVTNYAADAEASESGAVWVGIEYPRTAVGEPTCMIQTATSHVGPWVAFITTSCSEEKLITALKWLNYGYTEEGMMYWNYGKEGETYTVDGNGNIEWTELIAEDPDGLNTAVTKYTGVVNAGITVQLSQFVQKKNSEAAANAVYKWVENTEAAKHYMPNVALTVEESTEYSDLFTNINEFTRTAALEFVTGARGIEEFDAFVEELNEYGLERCLELQQAAYDRYLAK